MDPKGSVSLQVKPEIVDQIVRSEIQAAIVRTLSKDPEQLIAAMVKAALNEKVDEDGNRPRYNGDGKYDYVEILFKKTIKDMAKEAIKAFAEQNKDKIQKAMELEMKKHHKALVANFYKTIMETTTSNYRIAVNIVEK